MIINTCDLIAHSSQFNFKPHETLFFLPIFRVNRISFLLIKFICLQKKKQKEKYIPLRRFEVVPVHLVFSMISNQMNLNLMIQMC